MRGKPFLLLLGLQTVGAAGIVAYALPFNWTVATSPVGIEGSSSRFNVVLIATVLILVGYWPALGRVPEWRPFAGRLCGHALQFLGRIVFLVPTAVFSFVFIQQPPGLLSRTEAMLLVLAEFSMYCYSLQLDRIGSAWQCPTGRT